MRKVIYSMCVSLDGFIAARDGDIGWAAPDRELHRFHTSRCVRSVSSCGRRLYEEMLFWDAPLRRSPTVRTQGPALSRVGLGELDRRRFDVAAARR